MHQSRPVEPNGPLPQTVDDPLRQSRLAFLGLSDQDAENLQALKPLFEKFQREFVEEFYGHLFAFEPTARFLTDPDRVERLKLLQRRHFESLLDAQWDAAYFEHRRRVGNVHAEVGVEPEYFLGAYNQYMQHCLKYFAAEGAPFAGPVHQWISSLVKSMFLDIGLTLDAYFLRSTRDLRSALELLWRANQELRQFARLTSHDLKTPLATVANLCDEAIDEFGDQMPKEARELVASARQAAFRMSSLIDELLSQVVAPPSTEVCTALSTAIPIEEAVERIRPLITSKGIQLVLPTEWPDVFANKVRLREACYNLLSNAAKFVDAKHGRIEISIQNVEDRVRISVIDNGPGIPPDELERIFVPFRRLPMHRSLPGSGLGLYFTKNLIEDQGGRVWAESELGHGAAMHIELPQPNSESARSKIRTNGPG